MISLKRLALGGIAAILLSDPLLAGAIQRRPGRPQVPPRIARSTLLGRLNRGDQLDFVVSLQIRDEPALKQLILDQADPRSPHFLTCIIHDPSDGRVDSSVCRCDWSFLTTGAASLALAACF